MKIRLVLPVVGLTFVSVLAYSYSASAARTVRERGEVRRDSAATAGSGQEAMVRFVNAVPGSPALELGEDTLMIFSNVVFAAVSPYKAVRRNQTRFTLRTAASRNVALSLAASMHAGERYTMLAVATPQGGMALRLVRDDLRPDAGRARVRVLNAAQTAGAVTMIMHGRRVPLFASAGGGDLGMLDVEPGTARFTVSRDSDRVVLMQFDRMALAPGTAYTFVLAARPRGDMSAITFSDVIDLQARRAAVAVR